MISLTQILQAHKSFTEFFMGWWHFSVMCILL